MATYTMTGRHGAETFNAVCDFEGDDGSQVSVEVSPAGIKAMFGYRESDGKTMSNDKVAALYQVVKTLASEIFYGVSNEYKFEFSFGK
jgi:hypothetical protein